MEIKQLAPSTHQSEYGYPRQYDVSYEVLVTAAESAGLNIYTIHRIVENQTIFAPLANIRSSCEQRAGGGYRFVVTGSVLQDALRQDNFVFKYYSGLNTESKGTDIYDQLNTVQYPGFAATADITTAIVDVPVPSFEITATGIRDLSRYADPDTDPAQVLQVLWLNKVNSAYWKGIPERQALCTSCVCEPHYLKGTQYVYVIQFRFSVKPNDTHDPWIYYTDSAGRVPSDSANYLIGTAIDYDASYRKTHQYGSIDYNSTFPLGTEEA